jgi:hypothetical protein
MGQHFVDFNNETDRTWSIVVYQTIQNSIGLDSVDWISGRVPPHGCCTLEWVEEYAVALAEHSQDTSLGIYRPFQVLTTPLGYEWDIIYKDGVQQLAMIQALPTDLQDHILINNKSGLEANPGIGMAGRGSVYKRNVLNNASAQFKVSPTYWVGLFRDIQHGEVISINVEVDPIKLQFVEGVNVATLTATREGDSLEFYASYSRREPS